MKLNLKMFLSPEEIEAQIDLAPGRLSFRAAVGVTRRFGHFPAVV